VSPERSTFTIAPGATESVTVSIYLENSNAKSPVPPPVFTASWQWDEHYPYPQNLRRQLELHPKLTIAKAKTKPTFSNNWKDDWFSDATRFMLDHVYFYDPGCPSRKRLWGGMGDLTAEIAMKWDDDALYIAADVMDNEHVQNVPHTMAWSQDSIMVGVQIQRGNWWELGFASYDDRDDIIQYRNPNKELDTSDMKFKSTRTQGRVLYEIALPWKCLTTNTLTVGDTIRFTVLVNDTDNNPNKGFNYMTWTPGIHYGKNANDFGEVILGK